MIIMMAANKMSPTAQPLVCRPAREYASLLTADPSSASDDRPHHGTCGGCRHYPLRLGREVGTSAYRDPKRRPKTVRYWEMTPTAGTLGPANEVDDARWVPLQEAPRLLTYHHDRRLLEGWHPAG
jgi:hypothetical protein